MNYQRQHARKEVIWRICKRVGGKQSTPAEIRSTPSDLLMSKKRKSREEAHKITSYSFPRPISQLCLLCDALQPIESHKVPSTCTVGSCWLSLVLPGLSQHNQSLRQPELLKIGPFTQAIAGQTELVSVVLWFILRK